MGTYSDPSIYLQRNRDGESRKLEVHCQPLRIVVSSDDSLIAYGDTQSVGVIDLTTGEHVFESEAGDNSIQSLHFGSGNRFLVADVRSGGAPGVVVFDLKDRRIVQFPKVENSRSRTLWISSTATLVHSENSGYGIRLLKRALDVNGELEAEPTTILQLDGSIGSMAVHERSGVAAASVFDGMSAEIELIDLGTGTRFAKLTGRVTAGSVLVDAKRDRLFQSGTLGLYEWDLAAGERTFSFKAMGQTLGIRDSTVLIRSGTSVSRISLSNPTQEQRLLSVQLQRDDPFVPSANLQYAATVQGSSIVLFDLQTDQKICECTRAAKTSITHLATTDEGNWICAIDAEGTIEVWSRQSGASESVARVRIPSSKFDEASSCLASKSHSRGIPSCRRVRLGVH